MTEKFSESPFNLLYDVYDNVKIFRDVAKRLVDNAKLTQGQRVLDVACGTGWATIAAAKAVGQKGYITGVDNAYKMLEAAKKKTASAGLTNVEYCVQDTTALEFDDNSYDVVICASSIFLLQDIPKAVREWRRVLKVGGQLAFTSLGVDFMQPMTRLFNERLAQYGGQTSTGPLPTARTDTTDKCRELLLQTGFVSLKITTEQLGYYYKDTEVYWQDLTSTGVKFRLNHLSPDSFEKFKAEHLAEVESLRTEKGIWMNTPTLFSLAKKPSV